MSLYQTRRTPPPSRRDLRAYIPPTTPATWVTLGVGGLLGLILGLIIGWQVLPVQWTQAWPGDLSREARAQYLAAVAEAYVYYGDDEAAEIARNRLFDLNTDLEAQIADAVDFFAATRPRNYSATISNLGLLAQRLDAVPAAPPPAASGVGDTVRAWVNWTLTALAAIILAGGGIWIVNRMQQRRAQDDGLADDPGGFEEEESVGAPRPVVGARPFMRPDALRPVSETSRGTTLEPAQSEEYGFEDEVHDDDDVYRPSRPLVTGDDYALHDEEFEAEGPYADDEEFGDEVMHAGVDEEFPDDAFADEHFEDDEPTERGRYSAVGYDDLDETEVIPSGARQPSQLRAVDPFEALDEEEASPPPRQSGPLAAPMRGNRSAKAARVLQTFSVHYQAGLPELNKSYNQAYTIVDPESGRAIGECGMMVNSINGILDNDPDSVIAMEVWLVDKKQELTFSSQDRILISEYAYDRGLETKITRERPNDPHPIIPQGGRTPFEIKGPNLLLQCDVVEAVYAKSGPRKGVFESLRIEMTVLSRD